MNRAAVLLASFSFEIVSCSIFASAVVFLLVAPYRHATSFPMKQPDATPVVVELFTSEGCSSCPPADALLARYEREQPVANAQIIALEEHVDYWNELGWVDPFSSKKWTNRQTEYAATLSNGNPYTPQIVVDGRIEFVGSRESQARQVIAREAAQPKSQVRVTFQEGKPGAGSVQIEVAKLVSTSQADSPEVWLAITESDLHSGVTSGENAGRALAHASVVRALQKLGVAQENAGIAFSQTKSFQFDSRWKLPNLHAVAFVQELKSRRILGAAIAGITPWN